MLSVAFACGLIVFSIEAFAGSVAQPQITKLDNGLKVMVVEDHTATLAAMDVWLRAGTVNESESSNGVSHLIEHLIFKGTTRRRPGEMDMEIESLGATLEAATSKDWARFYTTVPSKHLDKAMDVLADAMMSAQMDEVEFEYERAVVWDEIASAESDPTATAFALLDATAFTKHPYRFPLEGTRESLTKLGRKDVYDYYKRYYVPSNATLIIIGDVLFARVVESAKKYFGDWKGGAFPITQATEETPQTEIRRAYKKRDTKLAYLVIGYHSPSVASGQESSAMDALLTYLSVGYQSWMSVELKDKLKLAQEFAGEYLTHRDPGLLALYAAVPPDKVKETEDLILAKLKELSEKPLSKSDLQRTKRSLLGTYAFECETFSGRARSLGFYDAVGNYTVAVEYEKQINSVTAEDVQSVAAKYLKPDTRTVVVISPEAPPK